MTKWIWPKFCEYVWIYDNNDPYLLNLTKNFLIILTTTNLKMWPNLKSKNLYNIFKIQFIWKINLWNKNINTPDKPGR